MQTSAKPEGQQLSQVLGAAVSLDGLQVYMPIQETVHWFIPQPVEFLKSGGIPPVLIELPVSKLRQLPKHIGDVLEHNVE